MCFDKFWSDVTSHVAASNKTSLEATILLHVKDEMALDLGGSLRNGCLRNKASTVRRRWKRRPFYVRTRSDRRTEEYC